MKSSSKIIAIVNQKGGTGKTTTTVNLGAALSKLGYKVLLIDLDAQASLTYYFGLQGFEKSISEVLWENLPLIEASLPVEGLEVIPARQDLADTELSLSKREKRLHILENALNQPLAYDYVLLDCPPSLSLLTINALIASRKLIIPLQLEVLSLHGMGLLFSTLNRLSVYLGKEPEILGILLTKVSDNLDIYREVQEYLYGHFDLRIFNSRIWQCEHIIESPSFAQSVVQYRPYSKGAQSYMNLARELDLITSEDRLQEVLHTGVS